MAPASISPRSPKTITISGLALSNIFVNSAIIIDKANDIVFPVSGSRLTGTCSIISIPEDSISSIVYPYL